MTKQTTVTIKARFNATLIDLTRTFVYVIQEDDFLDKLDLAIKADLYDNNLPSLQVLVSDMIKQDINSLTYTTDKHCFKIRLTTQKINLIKGQ